jgi:hypothetical protein
MPDQSGREWQTFDRMVEGAAFDFLREKYSHTARRAAWSLLKALRESRSDQQVAELERARGLRR